MGKDSQSKSSEGVTFHQCGCQHADVKKIHGTKINQDEFVNLLNRWKGSALNLVLTIFLPEVTTMLTIVIDKVELPTVTVALERSEKLSRDTIDVHFKGCVLERFEGDEGVGTVVRASWLSRTRREVLLAETT